MEPEQASGWGSAQDTFEINSAFPIGVYQSIVVAVWGRLKKMFSQPLGIL